MRRLVALLCAVSLVGIVPATAAADDAPCQTGPGDVSGTVYITPCPTGITVDEAPTWHTGITNQIPQYYTGSVDWGRTVTANTTCVGTTMTWSVYRANSYPIEYLNSPPGQFSTPASQTAVPINIMTPTFGGFGTHYLVIEAACYPNLQGGGQIILKFQGFSNPPPFNHRPTVTCTATPGDAPDRYSFEATGTDVDAGDSLTYSWNFDDATPAGTTATVNHDFAGGGHYNVTVTATDSHAAFATASCPVDVPGALVVNTITDESDADLTDGLCDTRADADVATLQCTLRAAIEESNARQEAGDGSQSIAFDIDAAGAVPQIVPGAPLPDVTGTTTIDGSTQPGGWVELAGNAAGVSDGLTLAGSGDTVRGLVINGFAGRETVAGANFIPGTAGLVLAGIGGHVIVGNRIGTTAGGSDPAGNAVGVVIRSSGNRVGGIAGSTAPCSGDCNLVSGNLDEQVDVLSADTVIQGNVIGLDRAASQLVASGAHGIVVRAASVTIGGTSTTAGTFPGNIIGGAADLIRLSHGADDAVIAGNLIGLTATGASLASSSRDGIVVTADRVIIGGAALGDRNVIGGATSEPDDVGVGIKVVSGTGVVIRGNLVGLDPTGESARPNDIGILIGADGQTPTATVIRGNVVSGNTRSGIASNDVTATVVGNRIGTNALGTSAVPNGTGLLSRSLIGGIRPPGATACEDPCNLISGNLEDGAQAAGAQGNFIGTDITGTLRLANGGDGLAVYEGDAGGDGNASVGQCTGACNLVSGNAGFGIVVGLGRVSGEIGQILPQATAVRGNIVGRSLTGNALANDAGGILVTSVGATVGGVLPADRNWISGNGGPGVLVVGTGLGGPARATIRGNRIDGNAAQGIDLRPDAQPTGDGVTPNDFFEDLDVGGNGLQNKPMVGTARRIGGTLAVSGTFERPSEDLLETYTIELFANDACDASGFGEGERPLGLVTSIGLAGAWQALIAVAATPAFVTATITDEEGNTSEFGPCWPVLGGTPVTLQGNVGDSEIQVASTSGFAIGEQVEVGTGTDHAEVTTVVGFGSLFVDPPLRFPHAIDEIVTNLGLSPDTTISVGPADDSVTRVQTAGLEFSSATPGAMFQCALDAAAFGPCTSPRTLAQLADGTHVFQVRAVLADGRFDPSPERRTWRVDSIAPAITILRPLAGATYAQGQVVKSQFSCDDSGGSGIASCSGSSRVDTTILGKRSFTVSATDRAGNSASRSESYAVIPPCGLCRLLVSSLPTRSSAVPLDGSRRSGLLFIFVSPDPGILSARFTLDGRAVSTDSSPPWDMVSVGPFPLPVPSRLLARGSHTVTVVLRLSDNSTKTLSATFTLTR